MKKPDMFADPEGFQKWLMDAEITRSKREELINRSFDKLKQRNPKEFREAHEAYNALLSLNPKNQTHRKIAQKICDADNPAKSLLRWWRGEDK